MVIGGGGTRPGFLAEGRGGGAPDDDGVDDCTGDAAVGCSSDTPVGPLAPAGEVSEPRWPLVNGGGSGGGGPACGRVMELVLLLVLVVLLFAFVCVASGGGRFRIGGGDAPTNAGDIGDTDLTIPIGILAGDVLAVSVCIGIGEAARLSAGDTRSEPNKLFVPMNGRFSRIDATTPLAFASRIASTRSLLSCRNFAFVRCAFLDAWSVLPFCSGASDT